MSDPGASSTGTASPGSHYQPSIIVVVTILVLFVGASFFFLRSTPASSTNSSPTSVPTTVPGTPTTTIPLSQVRVQVLNGTSIAGLAHTWSQFLTVRTWDVLPPTNSTATTTATIVYYTGSFSWAATKIAASIKVPASAVKPLGTATPVAGAASDDVIVVLGPNVGKG